MTLPRKSPPAPCATEKSAAAVKVKPPTPQGEPCTDTLESVRDLATDPREGRLAVVEIDRMTAP